MPKKGSKRLFEEALEYPNRVSGYRMRIPQKTTEFGTSPATIAKMRDQVIGTKNFEDINELREHIKKNDYNPGEQPKNKIVNEQGKGMEKHQPAKKVKPPKPTQRRHNGYTIGQAQQLRWHDIYQKYD